MTRRFQVLGQTSEIAFAQIEEHRLNEITVEKAVAEFGALAKSKLGNPSATGEPEDQLRAPFEQLLSRLAVLAGFKALSVVAVGETSLSEIRTRPDYAITVHGALAGFVELKAPRKGADPTRFKGQHDKTQWAKLASLPNLIYCDGNSFSLWRNGELACPLVHLDGDIEKSGNLLRPGKGLVELFELFLRWEPTPPSSAKELAEVSARLCRLLRDEVSEALGRKVEALTSLATDWRGLLFPYATDKQFADGYAQAVTFGLLMARARGITIGDDLHKVADGLKDSASLIGAALQLLTDSKETREELKTALHTLGRVLDAVDWAKISKGKSDAWLYFYEDFLGTYDNELRKATGSYYTPPQVVTAMVSLVDQALRGPGFELPQGLATDSVIVADPATGTGTYLLGVLRHLARQVEEDEGPGAVPGAVETVLRRLIAFELQLGPFAVAQLRVLAEVQALTGAPPSHSPQMYVTDTLSNPHDDGGAFPGFTAAIGKQRKAANRVKREQPITVVIGNPPYKDKAKGLGGWVEGEGRARGAYAPLDDWQPPKPWGLGVHAKHLRNLYVYFWRWAARKVFEDVPGQQPGGGSGIVAYITAAGFLSGPGFERMRQSLRQRCHEIWVIDCTPEGHQPEVSSRIFQGVQQPLCIVLATRWPDTAGADKPLARVRWRALPSGHRNDKFEALQQMRLDAAGWQDCPQQDRAPFLPSASGAWAEFVPLAQLFDYDGSGVMPGRTWVIAPDAASLVRRWKTLQAAKPEDKERLFHPHIRGGKLGDKHAHKVVDKPLAGMAPRLLSAAADSGEPLAPVRYGFRSFDRQWILPDSRLINQANPTLWQWRSDKQVSITALMVKSPTSGPAITISAHISDLDHYKGSFGGRVFPLWADAQATTPNLRPAVLAQLQAQLGQAVSAEDLFAYIAAVAAHPGYIQRFATDLATPGLRIPLTADAALFAEAVALGRRLIWLHTFGERFVDAAQQRPAGAPRLPNGQRPQVPVGGAIPNTPEGMPDALAYDPVLQRLSVGQGHIEPVPKAVWDYEVSGKQVLVQWFSYRRKTRDRPQIGDRRPPSPLSDIQPDHWLPEYTTELLNLLNVLGLLVELEPQADELLGRLCAGALLTQSMLAATGAFFPAGHIPAGATEQPTLPGFEVAGGSDENTNR
jgi:hypothetical protein